MKYFQWSWFYSGVVICASQSTYIYLLKTLFLRFLGLTRCQRHAGEGSTQVGAFIPQCTENGEYAPVQCHGSIGHCWCVDEQGAEILGTRRGPGQGEVVCGGK